MRNENAAAMQTIQDWSNRYPARLMLLLPTFASQLHVYAAALRDHGGDGPSSQLAQR